MEALELKDFGFAYTAAPNTWVWQHLDWTVEEGSFAVLAGNTGSGKTTLLRMAHPALAPAGQRQGTLMLFGNNIENYEHNQATALVAYVGQHPADQIVCDSVWHELAFSMENLGVAQNEMRRRVAEIAHYFGIEPWLHAPTAELSGGQMQLLNVAAALACRPRMLLLDEPTAQLDPVAAQDFIAALVRVNHEVGITVLVATHEPYVFAPYATNELHLAEHEVQTPQPGRETTSYAAPQQKPTAAKTTQAAQGQAMKLSTKQLQKDQLALQNENLCLQLSEVFFRYERDLPWVLRGLNLNVARSSIHALVGGNGSGKSSVLFLAADTRTPQRGQVRKTAQRQAFLPQDPKLLLVCDTVAEELAEWQQGCGYNEDNIAREVDRFGLARILNQHPFDTSGGQQQCIALAKLLLTKPDLLLLDEPTKGLDAPTRRLLAGVLRALQQTGTTIVLATHDLAFVNAIAEQVTMLFDGQDAQTEAPAQFFKNNLFIKPSEAAQEALGLKGGYVE